MQDGRIARCATFEFGVPVSMLLTNCNSTDRMIRVSTRKSSAGLAQS